MAKFRTPIELFQNEVIAPVIDPQATAPTTPVAGQVYFDTTLGELRWYDGTAWRSAFGGISDVTGTTPVSVSVSNHVANVSVALATPSSDGLMPAADKAKLDNATDASTASTLVLRDAAGNASFNLITLTGVPTDPNHVVRKADLDAAIAGTDFQPDVIDVQVDATLDPGASPAVGARYIITNAASLHANFGTISGLQDNDIVEYDGSQWVVAYDVSQAGEGALVWVQALNAFYRYDGVDWSEFGGLAGVTAGVGLNKSGNTMNIGAADASIVLEPDAIRVGVDGSTIVVGASGLEVPAGGITATQINSSALGTTLTGGNGTPIEVEGYTVAAGATVSRKVAVTVTDMGGGVTKSVPHPLGTKDLIVRVYDATTDEEIYCDVQVTTTDVKVTATGSLFSARVVIMG